MIATRITFGLQALCAALLLVGLLVAAFMSDREAAGMIIALQIALPLVVVLPLSAISSIIVLKNGQKRDRIRLGIWYALIVVIICLFVFLDVLNERASAIISMPVAAAALIATVVWLLKSR